MITIPTGEIKQPSYHADDLGFVFKWHGHLLRGIYPNAVNQAKGYFESGFVEEIVKKKLFPKTWISVFENEQFGLIIEHELIEPVTYATEWNFQMLKDAAMLLLDIALIGRKYGYDMIDCHKLNVMFYHNRPLYVDLGSFVPVKKGAKGWKPFSSFMQSYFYILDVWSHGASQLAKRMMAPHVEMNDQDYLVYKSWLCRVCPPILNARIMVRKRVCELANMSDEQTEIYIKEVGPLWGALANYSRKIVKGFRFAPSQHLERYKRRVCKMTLGAVPAMSVHFENSDVSLIETLQKQFPEIQTATVINALNGSIYGDIIQKSSINRIVSIQENECKARQEYLYYQQKDFNICCVNVVLSGDGVLVRDKFPEERLSSELVILPGYEVSRGSFGVHNALVRVESLFIYSKLEKIVMTTNTKYKDFIRGCQERFNVTQLNTEIISNSNGRDKFADGCVILIISKK